MKSDDINENLIRKIVREEIENYNNSFEIKIEDSFTKKEKELILKAEEEYKNKQTISFEEIYNDL